MKKPSFEEILELRTESRNKWLIPREKFEKDQKFYELEFGDMLNIPEDFKSQGIILPTARDMVDTYVDHIDLSHARVFANKKGIHKTNEWESEMMRKFYLGIIHRTNVESDISPWRVAGKHYAIHGLTVMRTLWDADRWPDKPEQKEGESEDTYAERIDTWREQTHQSIPIDIQAIHPHNIIPDPSYGGRGFVFEVQEKICFDIKKRWPNWGNPKGKQITDLVDFSMYWDDTYKCYFVDDEPVLKIRGGVAPHNYGFIPYVFIDSGLGNISYDNKPEMRYVGMLRYMFDLLIAQSRDFSIADIILAKTSWGGGFLEGENAQAVGDISQKFGDWTRLPEGVKAIPVTPQVPPDALNLHLARTTDFIDAHAAPRSLRGLSESGVRSGADRRLVITEASSRYQYSKDAFSNGASKVLTNCALLTKNVIPGNVRVWARTPTDEFDIEIDKKKMKEPFTCYVEWSPISEEDEYRRHDDLERLISSGIVTKKWARGRMSDVDPIAMRRDEEKELMRQSPQYMALKEQYLLGQFMQTTGLMPPIEEGGEAGRRLVPPTSEKPIPGSANALQNNMRGLRSQTSMNPFQGMGGGGNR